MEAPSDTSDTETTGDMGKTVRKGSGTFGAMGLDSHLLKAIQRKGFRLPTPIQRKCIPPLLEGRDVVGMARTGSGKTAAFVLPLLQVLRAHSVKVGIRGLILSPSRELALQTFSVVKELSKLTDLRSVILVGGENFEDQFAQLATNPDIVVATPGRLMHVCVETKLSLKEVKFIVWDEADRLMEDPTMGQQMHEISARLPENRQTMLFSATLPKALADFAQAGLKNPLLVRLDVESKLSPDLHMSFLHVQSETRDAILLLLLNRIITDRKQLTVIFTATKHHVEYLQELFLAFNLPCTYIYGSMDQVARKNAIEAFRRGSKPILIVTDVAARGIDIPLLDNVINYDFPPSSKLFVHRVGRVARAGRSGRAFSLVTPDEMPYLFDLQLFLGPALVPASTVQTDTGASEKRIILGTAPQTLIDEEQESITQKYSVSGTLTELKKVMGNATGLYRRTRSAPSPESHRRAKEFKDGHPVLGVHPLFTPIIGRVERLQSNLVQAIQSFKPKRGNHLGLSMPVSNMARQKRITTPNATPTIRDEVNYLKYAKDETVDESGYSLTNGGSFAEQARRAVFEVTGEDESRKNRKQDDSRRKLVKTEFGTKVPASFRTDAFDKWRAKTHLDIQQPGEVESEIASGRAKSLLVAGDERRRWRNKRTKKRKPTKQ